MAEVKILPEIRMGDPFEMMRLRSLDKLILPSPQEVGAQVANARPLGKIIIIIMSLEKG